MTQRIIYPSGVTNITTGKIWFNGTEYDSLAAAATAASTTSLSAVDFYVGVGDRTGKAEDDTSAVITTVALASDDTSSSILSSLAGKQLNLYCNKLGFAERINAYANARIHVYDAANVGADGKRTNSIKSFKYWSESLERGNDSDIVIERAVFDDQDKIVYVKKQGGSCGLSAINLSCINCQFTFDGQPSNAVVFKNKAYDSTLMLSGCTIDGAYTLASTCSEKSACTSKSFEIYDSQITNLKIGSTENALMKLAAEGASSDETNLTFKVVNSTITVADGVSTSTFGVGKSSMADNGNGYYNILIENSTVPPVKVTTQAKSFDPVTIATGKDWNVVGLSSTDASAVLPEPYTPTPPVPPPTPSTDIDPDFALDHLSAIKDTTLGDSVMVGFDVANTLSAIAVGINEFNALKKSLKKVADAVSAASYSFYSDNASLSDTHAVVEINNNLALALSAIVEIGIA